MRTVAKWIVGFLAATGAVAVAAALGFAALGISSRSEPPALEMKLARTARHLMIPAAARRAENPQPAAPEIHARALRHWADHCASCHGNDGKGQTSIGRGLYPKSPDMTLAATQELSDGELFWIIENGVKLTGMPAWGSLAPDDDAETWELVHFVRHLPEITAEELDQMQRLNPVSRADLERAQASERFMAGEEADDEARQRNPPEHHHGSGGKAGQPKGEPG
jgi:mono/diheme cytochrome c family protein